MNETHKRTYPPLPFLCNYAPTTMSSSARSRVHTVVCIMHPPSPKQVSTRWISYKTETVMDQWRAVRRWVGGASNPPDSPQCSAAQTLTHKFKWVCLHESHEMCPVCPTHRPPVKPRMSPFALCASTTQRHSGREIIFLSSLLLSVIINSFCRCSCTDIFLYTLKTSPSLN